MPNYQNIEPYSKAVHIMAQYGGPEMFKEYLLQKGYQVGFEMGKQAEKSTELWKVPLAVLSGFALCKACNLVQHKWNVYQEKKARRKTKSCDKKPEVEEQNQQGDGLEQQQMQKRLITPMDC